MAITVEIDKNGKRVETVGGVVQLINRANDYAAGRLVVTHILVSYAPLNFHVVTLMGIAKGVPFRLQSSPTSPEVPLGTIVFQMVDAALEQSNVIPTG